MSEEIVTQMQSGPYRAWQVALDLFLEGAEGGRERITSELKRVRVKEIQPISVSNLEHSLELKFRDCRSAILT